MRKQKDTVNTPRLPVFNKSGFCQIVLQLSFISTPFYSAPIIDFPVEATDIILLSRLSRIPGSHSDIRSLVQPDPSGVCSGRTRLNYRDGCVSRFRPKDPLFLRFSRFPYLSCRHLANSHFANCAAQRPDAGDSSYYCAGAPCARRIATVNSATRFSQRPVTHSLRCTYPSCHLMRVRYTCQQRSIPESG